MQGIALAGVLTVVLGHAAFAGSQPEAAATVHSCAQSVLDVDGNQIWVNKEGSGVLTVVFESGFGNDSGVWSQIAPRIRAAGAQTLVYDRAGMGKSTINTATPYSIDNDVHILRTVLTSCGVNGPIVMVGHSYGGAMALVAASGDQRIQGLVLIEAVVPQAWPRSEVDNNLRLMRAQYDEVRAQAPALAKVAIPWAEAMPATAARIDGVHIAESLPIIDIVAEKGQNSEASATIWRDAHAAFTANHPHREHVLAVGSSHKVMADQPELVVEAILRMIARAKGP
jgi:pimeloyl-ACP methyl ester carboxylesterase